MRQSTALADPAQAEASLFGFRILIRLAALSGQCVGFDGKGTMGRGECYSRFEPCAPPWPPAPTLGTGGGHTIIE